jgi:hypothetical protein
MSGYRIICHLEHFDQITSISQSIEQCRSSNTVLECTWHAPKGLSCTHRVLVWQKEPKDLKDFKRDDGSWRQDADGINL